MTSHYGGFEWFLSINYHVPQLPFAVYTPLSNKSLESLIKKFRLRHGSKLISRYEAGSYIKKQIKENKLFLYGMAADQSAQIRSITYWKDFLGVKVPVFVGAEMVARELDFGVVYAKINRVKRGYYEASFELISDQPKKTKLNRITDTFTEWLEQDIYSDPTQYLWTHKRFKHADKAPQD